MTSSESGEKQHTQSQKINIIFHILYQSIIHIEIKKQYNRYQKETFIRNRLNNTIVLNDTDTEDKKSSSHRQNST